MPFVFYPVYTITHRPAAGVHMVRPELVQIRHRLGEEREETARPVCNWADPAAERETAGRPGPHPHPAGPPDRWRPPPGPRRAGHREPLGGYPPVRPRWNDRQPGGRGDTGETLVSPRTHPRCGPRTHRPPPRVRAGSRPPPDLRPPDRTVRAVPLRAARKPLPPRVSRFITMRQRHLTSRGRSLDDRWRDRVGSGPARVTRPAHRCCSDRTLPLLLLCRTARSAPS